MIGTDPDMFIDISIGICKNSLLFSFYFFTVEKKNKLPAESEAWEEVVKIRVFNGSVLQKE